MNPLGIGSLSDIVGYLPYNRPPGKLMRRRKTFGDRNNCEQMHLLPDVQFYLSTTINRRHSLPSRQDRNDLSYSENNIYSHRSDQEIRKSLTVLRNFLHIQDKESDLVSCYGKPLLEKLPINHCCKAEGCQRITINISGLKFETQLRTLCRMPNTLLGDAMKRQKYWDEKKREYFFDRHRPSFQSILYYYQSGGRLKKPLEVPMDIFLNEVNFFELDESAVISLKRCEGYIIDNALPDFNGGTLKSKIFKTIEYPESSRAAKLYAILSVMFILISVVTFCVETLPQFKESGCKNESAVTDDGNITNIVIIHWSSPLFLVESCCVMFFAIELIVRFSTCPFKVQFLKQILNWIDILYIAPFFVIFGKYKTN